MKKSVKESKFFDKKGYKTLKARGHSDKEIHEMFIEDGLEKIFWMLLALESESPKKTKKMLSNYAKAREKNPLKP